MKPTLVVPTVVVLLACLACRQTESDQGHSSSPSTTAAPAAAAAGPTELREGSSVVGSVSGSKGTFRGTSCKVKASNAEVKVNCSGKQTKLKQRDDGVKLKGPFGELKVKRKDYGWKLKQGDRDVAKLKRKGAQWELKVGDDVRFQTAATGSTAKVVDTAGKPKLEASGLRRDAEIVTFLALPASDMPPAAAIALLAWTRGG